MARVGHLWAALDGRTQLTTATIEFIRRAVDGLDYNAQRLDDD